MKLLTEKLLNKHIYIYKTEDFIISFKLLSWAEYKAVRDLISALPSKLEDLKDEVFKMCLIDCTLRIFYMNSNDEADIDFDILPAGLVEVLYNIVMMLSGSDSTDKILDDIDTMRMYSFSNAEERIVSMMKTLFRFTDKEIEEMYWPDILRMICQGELIMSGNVLDVPFNKEVEKEQSISDEFKKANKELGEVEA